MAQLSASCHGWQAQRAQWDVIVPLPGFFKQGPHTTDTEMGNTYSRKRSVRATLTCVFSSISGTKPPLHDCLICFGCHNKIPWTMVHTTDTYFSQFWGQALGVSGEKPFPPCRQLPPLNAQVVGRGKQGRGSLFYPCKATDLLGLNPCDLV